MPPDFIAMLRPFLMYGGGQPIAPNARLRDLGLDSMQEIELLFAIEDKYDIKLPYEMLTEKTFSTAGHLWATIEELSVEEGDETS